MVRLRPNKRANVAALLQRDPLGAARLPLQRHSSHVRITGMATRTLLVVAATVALHPTLARAQLSLSTFGGIPRWADSALRAERLGGGFMLSSTLNPVYAFGDFDRDGLADVAVEIKDTAGLRCGIAIVHRVDRSVHIVGAGQPIGNGTNELRCSEGWGVVAASVHGHRALGADLLYIVPRAAPSGWLVWNGHAYVWVQAD